MHLILLEELEHDPEKWNPVFSDKREPFVQRLCLTKRDRPHPDFIGMEQALIACAVGLLQLIQCWHGHDVIAGIHIMDFAGDA
jgi:hypothetical protein